MKGCEIMKKTRAVIYARYSSDNQREESIEGQVQACTELAEKDGMTIIKIYADRAMTGRNDKRPQFQQMLKDAQSGMFDVLYLWKIDRFGRNRYEIIINKQKLKNAKIPIRYVKEHIPDSKEGIILESMLEGMAEYYSVNLAENVNMGMERNAYKCMYNGGNIPFGYKVENKVFVLDKELVPVVKKIFLDYVDGKKVTDIARYLDSIGVSNYGRMGVLRIIRNKRYTGKYIYSLNGEEICIDGGMPRIIDDELFNRAQEIREEKKTKTNAGGIYAKNSFSGKIKCGYCGNTVALTSTRKYDGIGHYHYYRCSGKCKGKSYVVKQKVDKVVFDFLHNELFTEENIKAISDKAEQLQNKNPTTTLLNKQLKEIDKKIGNITKAIENGSFSQTLMDRLQALEKEKEDIKIKIATAPKKKIRTSKEIYNYLMQYVNGDYQDEYFQQKLIQTFIARLDLQKDSVLVTFKINDFSFSQSFVF